MNFKDILIYEMIYILIFIFALIITTMLNGQSKMKLRCCITFQQIKIEEKIRSKIEYGEHFLILTSFPKNPNSLEMIRNNIKIDSMYNNFLYLRNLKNFLFDEENQKVNSFMFIDE